LVVFLLPGFHLLAQSNPSPVESEISFVGGGSLGHVNLFAYADQRQLDLFGVQYARHSWGSLVTARVDYIAEVLPVVLLNEPKEYGTDSRALTKQRKWVYGAAIAPVGARLLWRRNKRWKPYLIGDGGVLYFKDRVLSTRGTHLNFSAEFGAGVQFRLYPRTQLRLGYSLYHFSNGDIARSNPGLDSNLIYMGLSFDLHK
jgi:opacity protein-like surface antigen